MTDPKSKDISSEIREQAVRFAKDFGISYDKISIKEKTGWVIYKTDTGGSGGWTEGTPATTIKQSIITRHYQLLQDARTTELKKLSARMRGQWNANPQKVRDNMNRLIDDRLTELKGEDNG